MAHKQEAARVLKEIEGLRDHERHLNNQVRGHGVRSEVTRAGQKLQN